jgi:hypothetical protein
VDYALVIPFALISLWAVLRVIGGERDRRVRDLAYTIALNPPDPAAAQNLPAPPVRSKPAR